LTDKYGSDHDKLTALREDRYVRAMEAKTLMKVSLKHIKLLMQHHRKSKISTDTYQ